MKRVTVTMPDNYYEAILYYMDSTGFLSPADYIRRMLLDKMKESPIPEGRMNIFKAKKGLNNLQAPTNISNTPVGEREKIIDDGLF